MSSPNASAQSTGSNDSWEVLSEYAIDSVSDETQSADAFDMAAGSSDAASGTSNSEFDDLWSKYAWIDEEDDNQSSSSIINYQLPLESIPISAEAKEFAAKSRQYIVDGNTDRDPCEKQLLKNVWGIGCPTTDTPTTLPWQNSPIWASLFQTTANYPRHYATTSDSHPSSSDATKSKAKHDFGFYRPSSSGATKCDDKSAFGFSLPNLWLRKKNAEFENEKGWIIASSKTLSIFVDPDGNKIALNYNFFDIVSVEYRGEKYFSYDCVPPAVADMLAAAKVVFGVLYPRRRHHFAYDF